MAGSWEVPRDVLFEAIRLLDLVPSQTGIPSSDFFLVEPEEDRKTIWMTTAAGAVANVKLLGSGQWPFSKPFYLDRRLFTPFISTFKEIKSKHNFEFFRTQKNELRVRYGKPFLDFSPRPPVMGYGGEAKYSVSKVQVNDDLLELMQCAASYSASETEPHLACIYMTPGEGVEILSCNQKIFFKAVYKGGHSFKTKIAFPLPMFGVMRAEGLKAVLWGEKCVAGRFANGRVWQTLSVEASKHFPAKELRASFERGVKLPTAFRAPASRFARVIERMSLYLQYVRKEDWVLNITGTKGSEQIFLVSRLPNAVIHEHLRVLEPVKTNFNFDWPLDQLGGLFKFISTSKDSVQVKLEPDAGMSYVKCGPIELAMSTKRV